MAKIQFVCIPATVYGLLVYLLYKSLDDIKRTRFFTYFTIPEQIRNKLPNNKYLEYRKNSKYSYVIKYKILRTLVAPELNTCKIYAQDHFPIAPYLIGNRKYTLMPDGPHYMEINAKQKWVKEAWTQREVSSGIKKILANFVSESMYGYIGKNALCEHLILTEDEDLPHTLNMQRTIVNIKEFWQQSSIDKQNYILNIFGVEKDIINNLSNKKVILFSSPFVDDGIISEEEQITIYRDAISKYNQENIIIKKHPRDTIDYRKHFNNVLVFDKPIPSQLFNLIGPKYETAITIFSTAVLDFDYDLNIEWIGTKVNPKLLAEFGDQKLEDYISKRNK